MAALESRAFGFEEAQSWFHSNCIQLVTICLKRDSGKRTHWRTSDRLAGPGIKDAFVAGAEQPVLLLLEVNGTGKVSACLAVGDKAPALQTKKHRLVLRPWIVEVNGLVVRYFCNTRNLLRRRFSHREESAEHREKCGTEK